MWKAFTRGGFLAWVLLQNKLRLCQQAKVLLSHIHLFLLCNKELFKYSVISQPFVLVLPYVSQDRCLWAVEGMSYSLLSFGWWILFQLGQGAIFVVVVVDFLSFFSCSEIMAAPNYGLVSNGYWSNFIWTLFYQITLNWYMIYILKFFFVWILNMG